MTRFLHFAVFVVGLAAIVWVGAGYVGTHQLALSVTALIGVVYLIGAWELFRFQRTTAQLGRAVDGLTEAPESLDTWLPTVPAALRQTVQLRVQGERVGLPGPALASYLVGLLVLLGMLGTFLGMVATLRGTGAALQSATDLQAIRASLAAPVMGLGFAFGTSVAGVAASAMLGLLAALCRSERLRIAQRVDLAVATTLRGYSLAHQREERVKLLSRQADMLALQADTLPAVVERLDAMMAALSGQSKTFGDNMLAGQEAFHARTEAAYARLAATLEHALKAGVADTAQAASAAIQPAVDATMTRLALEATTLHERVAASVQQHLDGLSSRLDASDRTMTDAWREALRDQRTSNEALNDRFGVALDGFAQTFDQRSGVLLDGMVTQLDGVSTRLSQAWHEALAQQKLGHQALAAANAQALTAAAESFDQQARALVERIGESQSTLVLKVTEANARVTQDVNDSHAGLARTLGESNLALTRDLNASNAALAQRLGESSSEVLAQLAQTHADLASRLTTSNTTLAREVGQAQHALTDQLAGSMATLADRVGLSTENLALGVNTQAAELADRVGKTASDLLETVGRSHAELRTEFADRDQARASSWVVAIDNLATSLREEWAKAGELTAARQQEICDALATTARAIASDTQTHARATIAQIEGLVQTAAEAPKVAAEVVIEVRQKLSESKARDNTMLEERSRLLETLGSLLDAVNHASTAQRTAVDALVSTSADMLARVGSQFTDRVERETEKLDGVAEKVTSSAAQMSSLSEGFGAAVGVFSASNDKLLDQLQRIESSLDATATRSDDQLAYYVAQAREVVDLSILSQKQIVENLQRLARAGETRAAVPSGSGSDEQVDQA